MPVFEPFRSRKIGLALGGGSARGWAHLGVLQVLHEHGIQPACIAGTSIGAVVGAFRAAGKDPALHDLVTRMNWRQFLNFFSFTFPRSGLVDGRRIADFIREQIGEIRIEDLPVPYAAVATDLARGTEVVLDRGDLITAVRASIAVPGIFTPVHRGADLLADGGLVNPVPVSVVRAMGADLVIAVDLNHDVVAAKGIARKKWFGATAAPREADPAPGPPAAGGDDAAGRFIDRFSQAFSALLARANAANARRNSAREDAPETAPPELPGIFETMIAAIVIMTKQITDARLAEETPDIIIRPRLGHINFIEFHRALEAIAEGRRAAEAALAAAMKNPAGAEFAP